VITLIAPPALKSISGLQMQSPAPPVGVAYLGGMLRKHGYAYSIIDAVGEALDQVRPFWGRDDIVVQGLEVDEIVERIPANSKFIGISVMFSTLWPVSAQLIHAVRKRFPAAFLFAGGEHVTAVPEHALRNSPLDLAVLGEGENTLIAVIEAIESGASLDTIDGVAFVDKDDRFVISSAAGPLRELDVDSLPLPDWDSVPITAYIESAQQNGCNIGRSMPILATRGCPYECTFCSNPLMYGRRWLPRTHVDVVDEMAHYKKRFNVTNFNFQDLTAFINRKWIVNFTNELIDRNLEVTWQLPSGTRSEVFDAEVADLIYRSGCRNLAFAPESGDPEVLKAVKKRVNLEALTKAAKTSVKRGLNLSVFIVIGFPTDSTSSMRNTLKLVRKMAWIGVQDCVISKFVPYPGSPLFHELQARGKIELDDEFFVSPMDFYTQGSESFCDNLSSKKLHFWMLYLFWNFYLISFATHPIRTVRILFRAIFTRYEETRYAKFLVEKLHTRTKFLRRRREAKKPAAKTEAVA